MLLKALIKLFVTIVVIVVAVIVAVTGGGGGSSGSGSGFTIGGTVSGLAGTVVLRNNGGDNLSLSGNGSFTFGTKVAPGAAYSVTVSTQPTNQQCTITSGSGTASSNVTGVVVTCVNTYTVGATVSGLQGSGLVLGNGPDSIPVVANTYVTFPTRVADGSSYAVSVQVPPGSPRQNCSVTNGNGMVNGADVTTPQVTCTTQISGVAAVGIPLVGKVTIKDSNNNVRTVDTGLDGDYLIDVSDMVPPFVLRATGAANGVTYSVYSAALASDVGGNINITPFTDLILSNVAQQLASRYFDNPSFASLTQEALNAETELLKQRLLPVLLALGVEDSVDLLRSQFTPLQSALDAALDVLHVSVDPATNIATITNIVTQQQIFDSIVVPAGGEAGAPVLDEQGNLDVVATDMAGVRATLNSFAGLYASGLPSLASVLAMTDPELRHYDSSRDDVAAALAGLTRMVGGSIADVQFQDMEYNASQVTATVDMTLQGPAGIEIVRLQSFKVRKQNSGPWLLLGDQHVLDFDLMATAEWRRGNRMTSFGGCALMGYTFHAGDEDPTNDGAAIDHLLLFGPGLPAAGLRLGRLNPGSDRFEVSTGGSTYFTGYNCGPLGKSDPSVDANVAAIPDNSDYMLAAYTSADVRINLPGGWSRGGNFPNGMARNGTYLTSVPKRPLTAVEAWAVLPFSDTGGPTTPPMVPGLWPFITSPVTGNYATGPGLSLYTGGSLTVSAAGMNPQHYAEMDLRVTTGGVTYGAEFDDALPDPTGFVTQTINVASPPLGACDIRRLKVTNTDAFRRQFTVTTQSSPNAAAACP